MDKRQILLSIITSMAATAIYEWIKKSFAIVTSLPLDGLWFFIAVAFLVLSIFWGLKLHQYKTITKKIKILGKDYYDIFEEIVYFQSMKSRNAIDIDKLKWNFDFTYNQQCSVFLDMHAKWDVQFTAREKQIKNVFIGIHGGGKAETGKMNIKADQNGSSLTVQSDETQDDCCSLKCNLNTSVMKNQSDKISLEYDWEKFTIDDRKDDYLYLFPFSHAKKINYFDLMTTHPYICSAKVFILKYRFGGEYKQIEVNSENCASLKIEFEKPERGTDHHITFSDINPRDIILIIFEKQ